MIKSITISNFRSIECQKVELAPFTVLYGPTASGKSSLLYALLVLKNFVNNPNQQTDGFFSFGFMNLGGFDSCVFNHEPKRAIQINLNYEKNGDSFEYMLSLEKNGAELRQKTNIGVDMKARVNIPYPVNQNFQFALTYEKNDYTINWNGISCTVVPKQTTPETQDKARELAVKLNVLPSVLNEIDIVPHRRGFFKPFYTPGTISLNPTTEDEVATLIINDPNLAPRISVDLEKILQRDFRLYTPPGTATVFFQTTDKKSNTPGYLVNDGFGTNQLIYLFAKVYRAGINTILIEEPEVHLHPSVIRQFVHVLCSIIKEDKRQIIITTHSENFVISILVAIAEKVISSEDIRCYFVTKEKRPTTFKQQKANENGQIEGGLSSFMTGELEDLKKFLSAK